MVGKQNKTSGRRNKASFFYPSNFFPFQSAKGRRADEALTTTRVADGDSDRAGRIQGKGEIGINRIGWEKRTLGEKKTEEEEREKEYEKGRLKEREDGDGDGKFRQDQGGASGHRLGLAVTLIP